MQSSLSQLLMAEHDVILEAGELISLKGSLWKSSPIEYEQIVKQLLDFFSVYGDEYHHLKEEEILFPAIGKKNEMVSGGIVQELLDHHEYFRILIRQIQTALDAREYAAAQKLLETYISTLKDHIAVENDETSQVLSKCSEEILLKTKDVIQLNKPIHYSPVHISHSSFCPSTIFQRGLLPLYNHCVWDMDAWKNICLTPVRIA